MCCFSAEGEVTVSKRGASANATQGARGAAHAQFLGLSPKGVVYEKVLGWNWGGCVRRGARHEPAKVAKGAVERARAD